jgi:hypothetical protein
MIQELFGQTVIGSISDDPECQREPSYEERSSVRNRSTILIGLGCPSSLHHHHRQDHDRTVATCTRDKLTREITPYLWVHPDEDR